MLKCTKNYYSYHVFLIVVKLTNTALLVKGNYMLLHHCCTYLQHGCQPFIYHKLFI